LLLALKLSCLAALPLSVVVAAMLAAHPLSRALAATVMWRLDYAGSEGKSAPVARRMSHGEFFFAALCGLLPMGLLVVLSWQAALAGMALALLSTTYLTCLFVRRIGGYTGDCLGAVQQLSETGFHLGVTSWYFSVGFGHGL
jgi:adenosylcobinamide-GDP ribazoletransferase